MRFDRRFYRSVVDEEEWESWFCDFLGKNCVILDGDGGDGDEREDVFDFRRFYRSGIGDLAKRPPALIRFCSRASLSR
jgi:hypothetical protein